jgi:16S rRNA (guanine(966)-N(2))-methyltransferase RsmD
MRIIAGTYKGRRLSAPSWTGLRPTSDKLRETIFNILAPRVPGARVLDLYAGTGALGIEALSRGAAAVTFVERDRRAQELIEENLERCRITDGYVIIRASVADALDELRDRSTAAQPSPFDIAFLDPPYEREPGAGEVTGVLAATASVMRQDAVVVLEHARRRPSAPTAGALVRTREVAAGESALAFYACRP